MIQKSIIGQLKAWILLLCKNCMDNLMHAISSISNAGEYMHYAKGPYRPDAIWQRDANFQFSMTFNFNIFQCFSNIRNHLSNFSYLVCISCKIFIRWRFYFFLKTENSRRVAESRPVCLDLDYLFLHTLTYINETFLIMTSNAEKIIFFLLFYCSREQIRLAENGL
jgi:hypothetical protein